MPFRPLATRPSANLRPRWAGILICCSAAVACAQGTSDQLPNEPNPPAPSAPDAAGPAPFGGEITSDAAARVSASDGASAGDAGTNGPSGADAAVLADGSSARVDASTAADATAPPPVVPPVPPVPPPPAAPDAGGPNPCPGGAAGAVCGLAPQCGCAANQTCGVASGPSGVACTTAGTGAVGAVCQSTSDCGVGLDCINSVCRPYCANPTGACSGAGVGRCVSYPSSLGSTGKFNACTIPCDLADTASCGGGSSVACVYSGAGVVDCGPVGGAAEGASCSSNRDCVAGMGCIGSVCNRWCHYDTGDGCSLFQVCSAVSPALTVNGVKYGYCY